MKTKLCTKCKVELTLDNFRKKKDCLFGVSSQCKNCEKEYQNINKEKIKDYHKIWYKENKIIQLESCHKRYKEKREQILDKCKDYYQSHKKEIKMYPSSNPEYKKDRYLQRTYGITLNDYNELLEAQNGVCAICGNPETTINKRGNRVQDLAVDHDHTTGKVRGLLCRKCNRILGDANENIAILTMATNYLKLHRR